MIRRITSRFLLTAVGFGVLATAGAADLTSRYQAGQQRSAQLRSAIRGENSRIEGFEGTISSLEGRLTAIERSVTIQERLLTAVDGQLYGARRRLAQLRAEWARDMSALAAQLRADYETPPPTLMGVVVDAGGFNQLLDGLSQLTAIERRNTIAAESVGCACRGRSRDCTPGRRSGATAAVDRRGARRTRHDRPAEAVDRRSRAGGRACAGPQQPAARARCSGHSCTRRRSSMRARRRHRRSPRAARSRPPAAARTLHSCHTAARTGSSQRPGTNYQVNQEPVIAARLDQLGEALKLHLIGISGYRTPQHSVEVGGFADDPHTRGEASDTPGVEGVPESTLLEFCLTRPFPGPREADHIQES